MKTNLWELKAQSLIHLWTISSPLVSPSSSPQGAREELSLQSSPKITTHSSLVVGLDNSARTSGNLLAPSFFFSLSLLFSWNAALFRLLEFYCQNDENQSWAEAAESSLPPSSRTTANLEALWWKSLALHVFLFRGFFPVIRYRWFWNTSYIVSFSSLLWPVKDWDLRQESRTCS